LFKVMLGGEKIGKKIKKIKSMGLKKESDVSDRVSLKVKIHHPEIKKIPDNKPDIKGRGKKSIVSDKKPFMPKMSDKKVNDEFQSKPDIKKVKAEAEKSIASQSVDKNKEFRQKQTIMWSGIVFFMILIIFVWTYNIKKTFKDVENNSSEQSLNVDLDKIGEELSARMKEMKANLEEIKAYGSQLASTTASSTLVTASSTSQDGLNQQYNQLPPDKNSIASTSSTTASEISRQELDELKAKLKDLEIKINANQ
jgi:hypothetical protein